MALTVSGDYFPLKEEIADEQFTPIPGECCVGRPLNGTFSVKNSLALHGFSIPQQTNDKQTYGGPVALHEVLFRREYECQVIRRLVNELSGVFLANQRGADHAMNVDEILHYSRSYRAVLKLSIEETQKALVRRSGDDADFLDELIKALVVSESAISFSEIIFFQQPQGGELVHQLLLWLQAHNNDCHLMMEELVREAQIETHHHYWPAVLGCLLQGRITEVVHLLQAVNNTSQSWLHTIQALNKMPLYQAAHSTVMDFQMKWQHWQSEVMHMLEQGNICEAMLPIAKILAGEQEAIKNAVEELSLPWYSLLVAQLLYRQPFGRLHHVQDMINHCVSQSGGKAAFDVHDHIILSVLKKNIIDTLKYSSEGFNSWWFAAHFADIFYQARYIHEKNSVGTNIRESLILEYGSSLMEERGLWVVGARYLEHCHDYGRFYLQEYLTRVSLTSTRTAFKVLSLCEHHGFTQQAASICRVMAQRELSEDRLGSALTWCRHGKDGNMATVVAERLLDKCKYETHSTSDVLDALGSTTLLMSKNLLFLAKLREFHQMCDAGNEKDACALLVSLISSRMAPVKYWLLLLMELLPLLESDKELFTPDQVFDLMNAMSEVMQYQTANVITAADKSQVEALQLSLSRCLAKATVCDIDTLVGIAAQ